MISWPLLRGHAGATRWAAAGSAAFALLGWADGAVAQKTPRIGVLGALSPEQAPHTAALREGLRELGYVEGQSIISEWRWAHADQRRFRDLAEELVRLNVAVLVADNNPAIVAAQKATRTIPIVMVIATDPVGMGFVASLARPGGNTTGLSFQSVEPDKHLQLLKEVVPHLARVAYVWDPTEPGRREGLVKAEAAAKSAGVPLHPVPTPSPDDLEPAFAVANRLRVAAVWLAGGSMHYAHRARIAELAILSRLPMYCLAPGYAEAGCLISYNASFSDQFRRAALYVDKLLRGSRPADLPIEQPTKFELVVNLKTARALGLTIPPALLLRADHVIR